MSAAWKGCALVGLAAVMLGCQAAETTTPARPAARSPATQAATLYKYAGSRQCVGGGISAEDARSALTASGVDVIEAGCGSDGRMHAAMCGVGDGRIVIVKVPSNQAPAARSQGFAPLGELPDAVPQRCR